MTGGRDPVARLRALCLALPEATERISHGSPAWFVGTGRCFASVADHHHGHPHLAVWVAAPPGVQGSLIDDAPERYFVPAYVGHKGWVGVVLDVDPDWDELADLLEDAWQVAATARQRAAATSGGSGTA